MPWSSLRRWLDALTSKKNRRTVRPRKSLPCGFDVLEERATPAQFTWNAAAGGDLMDATKWQGGIAPNGTDIDLVFPEFTPTQSIAITNLTVPPVSFKSITFSGGGYTLTGPTPITLGTPTVGSSIVTNRSGNLLALDVILRGPTSTITVTGTGVGLSITGAISDTVPVSTPTAPALSKTGNGTLFLSGNNILFDGSITALTGGGIIDISSNAALGSTLGSTTIQAGAQLRFNNTGVISENLFINSSLANLGAVLNQTGNNTLNGNIRMDSSSTFGAESGTTLTINGTVSDFNGAQQLTKEGFGTIALAGANTYRGQTNINHGILAISNARALGATTAGTVVNTDGNGDGTLRIDGGSGLTIVDELLTLNGYGANFGRGSLYNNTGDNVWTGNVNLGGIGNTSFDTRFWINPGTSFTITGVVQDPNNTFTNLEKRGLGTLVLYQENTYVGYTDIFEGVVRIHDSLGLGIFDDTGFSDTYVHNGATLEIQIKGAIDVVTGLPPVDSITLQPDMIATPENIIAVGLGLGNVGAIHSVSGRNTLTGDIRLGDMEIFAGLSQVSFDGGIGVDAPLVQTADDTYFTEDWSLTIPGTAYGDNLVKLGTGHLILPEFSDYDGTTDIRAGWITIRNADALGDYNNLLSDTQQAMVTVQAGAALHLLPVDDATPLQLFKNITIAGDGIAHANPKLNHQGALLSLGGDNVIGKRVDPVSGLLIDTLGGLITLSGNASIGVADAVAPLSFSQLLIKSSIVQQGAPLPPVVGSLTKLGPQRMILQDKNSFTGDFNINEGVVRVQHDDGLGGGVGNTIVAAGTALEIMNSVETENGGISAGLQFGAGEHLILNGTGNTLFGLHPLTLYNGDTLFRGTITLANNMILDLRTGSRFMIGGKLDDVGTTEPAGRSDVTVIGGGTLDLGGNNTHRGATIITAGSVLAIRHSGGLGFGDGTPTSGTFIEDGASLQLIGNITVSNEYLEIQGSGATGAASTPRWFQQGPSVITNGDTLGTQKNLVAGSVVNVQSDPRDANTLYVTTGGGGVFRSVDGGLHWSPLFDNAYNDLTGSYPSDSQSLFGGFLTISPTNPQLVYFATGDGSEDRNAYAGKGVFMSVDSGNTWTLLTTPVGIVAPGDENPLEGRGIFKLVIDPQDETRIFVAVNDNTVDGQADRTGIWRFDPVNGWYNMTGFTPGLALNDPISPTRKLNGSTRSSRVIQDFVVTSVAVGPTANNITITIVGGAALGSETISVSGTDITITVAIGQTPTSAVVALINGNAAAAALVTASGGTTTVFTNFLFTTNLIGATEPTDPGPEEDTSLNFGDQRTFSDLAISDVFMAPMVDPGNPTGPTGKQAQGTLQGITFTAQNRGVGGNNINVQFIAGGRAGRETVITGASSIRVYIEVGKSTVAMVRDAINNDAFASGLVVATSSSSPSTMVQPAGVMFLSGGDSTSIGTTFAPTQVLMFAKTGSAVFRTTEITSDTPAWKMFDGRTLAAGGGPSAFPSPHNGVAPFNGLIRISASWGNLGTGNNFGTAYALVSDADTRPGMWPNNGTVYAAYKSVGTHVVSSPATPADYREVGQNWTPITVPGILDHDFPHYSSILASPIDANLVYVAGYRQIFRSTDGGTTWTDITVDANGYSVAPGINSLSFDSSDGLLVATEEGVWRLNNAGGVLSWSNGFNGRFRVGNLNGDGLSIANINYVSSSPLSATRIIAGADHMGTIITSDGINWTRINDPAGTPAGVLGGKVFFHPSNPNIIYRSYTDYKGDRVYQQRSTDGGATFNTIWFNGTVFPKPEAPPGSFRDYEILGSPLVVDPVNNDRVLYGDWFGLDESLNGGNTFRYIRGPGVTTWISPASYQGTYVREPATSPFFAVDDVGSDIQVPSTIWAVGDYNYVEITKDYGTNWDDRTPNALGPTDTIVSVTVDPRNRDTAYLVVAGVGPDSKLFMTTDAGFTWIDITSDLDQSSLHSFALDPRTGDLYVGNEHGVYRQTPGSGTWVRFGEGLPQVSVRDIHIDTRLNTITIGTFGRGVYTLWLSDVLTTQASLLAVSGNPNWNGTINIKGDTVIGAQGTQAVPDDTINASLTILGVIDDSTGAYSLTKVGQGDVSLGGANTYDGDTFIAEGVVIVTNEKALGSNFGVTYVAENTALELQSSITSGETLYLKGKGFDVNGQYGGALRNTTGNNVFNGQIYLQDEIVAPPVVTPQIIHHYDFTTNLSDSVGTLPIVAPFGGTVSGGNFNFIGTYNPFPPPPSVNQGLRLTGGTSAPGNYTIDMRFQIDANTSWKRIIDFKDRQDDAGLYTFGTSLQFWGLGGATQNIHTGPAGTININTWYTLRMTREAATNLVVCYIDSGSGFVEQFRFIDSPQDAVISGANRLFFFIDDIVNVNGEWAGGKVDYITVWDKPLTTASVQQTTVTGVVIGVDSNSSLTITGAIDDDPTNPNAPNFSKDLTGTLILTNHNDYAGTTNVFQGELQIQHAHALGSTAAGTFVYQGAQLSLNSGAAPGFTVDAEPLSLSGAGKFDGVLDQGALFNVSGDNRWTGAIIFDSVPTPQTVPLTEFVGIGVASVNDTLDISGNITQAGTPTSYGLRKLGYGTVALSGNNTYTDITYIEAGWLNARSDSALGATTGGTIVLPGAALQLEAIAPLAGINIIGETLNVQGSGPTTRGALENLAGVNTWDGPIVLDASTLVYVDAGILILQNTATGPADTINNSGIATSFDLTKSGPGELDLPGTNASFIGHFWVDDGIAVIGTNTSLGTSVGIVDGTTVKDGATLRVLAGAVTTIAERLELNGAGETGTRGALEVWTTSAATKSWSGQITLETSSAISVMGPGKFAPARITNGVSGPSDLTKNGNGILLFTGAVANTYSGETHVNDGMLQLDKTGVQAIVGALVIGDGTGAAGSAAVQNLQSQQIPDGNSVTVVADGLFDVNGQSETVNSLSILDGNARTGDAGALTVGSLSMTGGTITLGATAAANNLVLRGDVAATSSATQSATITGAGNIVLDVAPLTFNVTNGPLTHDMIIAAPITATGAAEVVKSGNGVLVFQSTSARPGRVSGGVLQVDGVLPTVALSGGTLGGTGTVTSGVTVASGGVIDPGPTTGNKVGELKVGTTVLTPAATFYVDVFTAATHDLLTVNGSIDLGNATLAGFLDPALPLDGTQIPIIQGTAIINRFAQGDGAFIGGQKVDIFYTSTAVYIAKARTVATLAISTIRTPTVYGEPITFTITATPELGAGPVENDSPIEITITGPGPVITPTPFLVYMFGNTATFTFPQVVATAPHQTPALPTLEVGLHTLSAKLLQTNNFKEALSPSLNHTVNKATTQIAISTSITGPVFGQPFNLIASLSAAAPGAGVPTGSVTFSIDGGAASAPVSLSPTGQAVFPISGLNAGSHSVVVAYAGDSHFNLRTSTLTTFTINKATASIALSAAPTSSTYGDSVTFSASVSAVAPGAGTPGGSVTFFDTYGGVRVQLGAPRTLSGGPAVLIVNNLRGGLHSIDVVYSGDANFNGIGNPVPTGTPINPMPFTVARAAVSQTLTSSLPAGSTFGDTVTFTTTITGAGPAAATGTVTFLVDGVAAPGGPVTIVSNQASFGISTLSPGPHTITAIYSGDVNYLDTTASPATFSQTVNQKATTVSLVSTVTPSSTYGQSVIFRATVAATGTVPATRPTGNVIFTIDGVDQSPASAVVQATGVATFTISTLAPLAAPGHTVSARYVGDGNYFASSSPTINQIVNKAKPTITMTSSLNGPLTYPSYGDSVIITATVVPPFAGGVAPSSQVVFSYVVGGATQSFVRTLDPSGSAQVVVNNLVPPTTIITVNYAGDTNYLAADPQTLTQITDNANTNLTISSPPTSATYGTDVITATVASAVVGGVTPTGTVTFTLTLAAGGTVTFANVPVVAGVATMPHPDVDIYAQIQAVYNPAPSNGYNGSSRTLVRQLTITEASTATAVSASPTPGKFGGTATFTATITSTNSPIAPIGQVIFTIDTVDQAPVPVALGIATITNSTLTSATHTITARFVDTTGNFLNSSAPSPLSYVVQTGDTTVSLPSGSQSVEAQTATIVATILPVSPSAGVPDGQVRFTVDANPPVIVTIVGGQATYTNASLSVGPHTVLVDYLGSAGKYNASSASMTHTVLPANTATVVTSDNGGSAPYSKPTTITATVSHVGPGATPTGSVAFTVDGIAAGTVGLTNGVATLLLGQTLPVGPHTIVAQYTPNDVQFTASTGSFSQSFTVAGTSVALAANPAVVLVAGSVTLTANVAPTFAGGLIPPGTVTFNRIVSGVPTFLGSSAVNASGVASISTGTLPVGAANYNAVFVPSDPNFSGSTGVFNGTVTTTTTIQSTASTGVHGQPIILAQVGPSTPGGLVPTGSVKFTIKAGAAVIVNTVPLDANGVATLNTAPLAAGTYTITGAYVPAANETLFTAATSAPFAQTITRATAGMVVTSSAPTGSNYGEPVTFTATLSAQGGSLARPVGQVVFMVNGQPHTVNLVAAGTGSSVARLTVSGLPVGANTVTARFNQTSNFAAATGSISQQVKALATTVALSASPNPAFFTQNVVFVASVAAIGSAVVPSTGTVTFLLDNVPQATIAINSAGQAAFARVFDTAGNRNVVAVYNGATGFSASTSATLVESVNGNPIIIAVPGSARSGDAFPVTVTLLRAGTTQVDTSFFGAVTLALNSGPVGGVFNTMTANAVAGVVTFPVSLAKAGTYSFKVSAAGLPFITSSPIAITARNLNVLTATFVPAAGAMNFTLNATDFTGGLAANFTGPVSVILVTPPASGGTITGNTTGSFSGGSGSVNGLKFTANGKYLLRFLSGGLSVDFLVDTAGRVTGA